jgi:hypothetical protein
MCNAAGKCATGFIERKAASKRARGGGLLSWMIRSDHSARASNFFCTLRQGSGHTNMGTAALLKPSPRTFCVSKVGTTGVFFLWLRSSDNREKVGPFSTVPVDL